MPKLHNTNNHYLHLAYLCIYVKQIRFAITKSININLNFQPWFKEIYKNIYKTYNTDPVR